MLYGKACRREDKITVKLLREEHYCSLRLFFTTKHFTRECKTKEIEKIFRQTYRVVQKTNNISSMFKETFVHNLAEKKTQYN